MSTEKLILHLDLRHGSMPLVDVTQQLGFAVQAGWDRGGQRRALDGSPRPGTYDHSYRSYKLGEVVNDDLNEGIRACLLKLEPVASIINKFVQCGGAGSVSVGWLFSGTSGGGSISPDLLARLAKLSLSLELFLYGSPEAGHAEGGEMG